MGNKVITENQNNENSTGNDEKVLDEMMKKRQEYLEKIKSSTKVNTMDIDSIVSEENSENTNETFVNNKMLIDAEVKERNTVDINKKDEIQKNEKVSVNVNNIANDSSNVNKSTINNTNTSNNNVNISSNVVNINTNQPKKDIDLEHVAFEKIFKITLDETKADKMKYVETYLAQLMSLDKEPKFRVNDIDSLIMIFISEENKNIVSFLLSSYNRAYNIIEIKFKNELKDKFADFLKILASYLSLILLCPENFELESNKSKFESEFKKYVEETFEKDISELLNLLNNFESCTDDLSSCQKLFDVLINLYIKKNSESLIKHKTNVRFSFIRFFKMKN